MPRRPWTDATGHVDWPGAVATILSLGIAISMVIGITGAVATDQPLSEQGSQFLSTMFGASIGAVATYLGMAQRAAQGAARTRESDPTPPEK